MSNIVLEYLQLSTKYQQQYGPKTVLFYMVGSFYEIYSLMHSTTQEISNITPIVEVCSICNLNIASKQTTLGKGTIQDAYIPPFPTTNPTESEIAQWVHNCPESTIMMAGMRDYNLEKYVEKLIEVGYTVVVYDQTKDPHGHITRHLQQIYSPGTFLSSNISTSSSEIHLSNHIMAIWIETRSKGSSGCFMICGISVIDVFTAESFLFEYQTPITIPTIQHTAYDEMERIYTTYKPKEILFLSDKSLDISWLNTCFQQYATIIRTYDLKDKSNLKIQNCMKETYTKTILQSIYPQIHEINSIHEFQTNPIATQAFCFLMDFIYEVNPELLQKLHFPKFTNTSTRLLLVNRTLCQLHIIPTKENHGQFSSVETFLNKCSTPMGRRLFKHQLFHPTFDQEWLTQEYTRIAMILQSYTHKEIMDIRKECTMIKDVDKFIRQLVMKQIVPIGMYSMIKSIEQYWKLYKNPQTTNILKSIQGLDFTSYSQQIPLLLEYISSKFDFDHLSENNTTTTTTTTISKHGTSTYEDHVVCLRSGVDSLVDDLLETQANVYQHIQSIQHALETLMCQEHIIKIHETEKQGITLQLTKKRAKTLKLLLQNSQQTPIYLYEDHNVHPKDIIVSHATSTNDEIEFPLLRELIKQRIQLTQEIKQATQSAYQVVLQEIQTTWYPLLEQISCDIAKYDVLMNKAYLVREYNYCCPIIQVDHCSFDTRGQTSTCIRTPKENWEPHSFVSCKQLRHCLIEHIQTNEIYVPNDIHLGENISSDMKTNGMILSGYNGIGKTSFIRALGIAIIMAQSGMYVPAKEFLFYPYRSLFCNIEKNDNLFKNLSTFQLETSEIRTILHQADSYSLVLADEIMNSTEIQSGISIMIALLEELSTRSISFVIATHFNQLSDFEEIRHLVETYRIQLKHMEVKYDAKTNKMKYDRILRHGLGPRCYGLEVAKSLMLSSTFLERAHTLRTKYFLEEGALSGLLSLKPSKYSTKVLRGLCQECGMVMATDVHHILEQQFADEHGFIDHVYKHHAGNLKPVCKKCHHFLHHDKVDNTTLST